MKQLFSLLFYHDKDGWWVLHRKKPNSDTDSVQMYQPSVLRTMLYRLLRVKDYENERTSNHRDSE